VLLIREPDVEPIVSSAEEAKPERNPVVHWFNAYIKAPFAEFFSRCGLKLGFSILLLLMVFRLGEAMLGRMSLVFYGEIGFSTDEIALYSKFFGGVVTAVFSLLGAVINTRFGVIKGLMVGGIAMASSNLLFALMAITGPNVNLLMVTLLVDNFSAAFATVAFISFISYFTSRTFTGTQYALMSSVSNFGRTTLAASSGGIVDYLDGDWALFFVLTALMVIPGLLLLLWIGKQIRQYQDKYDAPLEEL
jgi:PAT family beta-lactamase induction signal transducer AmpG